jgi:hypothetical protein
MRQLNSNVFQQLASQIGHAFYSTFVLGLRRTMTKPRQFLRLPVVSHGAEFLVQGYLMVKSRYATDCDRAFPVKEKTFGAFDFLIAVFLNIGNFLSKRTSSALDGRREPEFYTLPVSFIRTHHNKDSSWEKVRLRNINLESYKNDLGFELIAEALGIDYPSKSGGSLSTLDLGTSSRGGPRPSA